MHTHAGYKMTSVVRAPSLPSSVGHLVSRPSMLRVQVAVEDLVGQCRVWWGNIGFGGAKPNALALKPPSWVVPMSSSADSKTSRMGMAVTCFRSHSTCPQHEPSLHQHSHTAVCFMTKHSHQPAYMHRGPANTSSSNRVGRSTGGAAWRAHVLG